MTMFLCAVSSPDETRRLNYCLIRSLCLAVLTLFYVGVPERERQRGKNTDEERQREERDKGREMVVVREADTPRETRGGRCTQTTRGIKGGI